MNGDASKGPSVLIIDDQVRNIQVLAEALGRDYDVIIATNGAEGLEIAERLTPDLVLLDVMMPDMDGYETCRRLRSNPGLRGMPVIFISALEDVLDKVRAFQAGGNDYVTKPFQPEEVLARVSTHVDLYRTRRELSEREAHLQRNLSELESAYTRLKEMSNRLLQSEKLAMIGQLAAGVAHEINNPLGFINSNLEMLHGYVDGFLQLIDAYEGIEDAADSEQRLRIEEARQGADIAFSRQDAGALITESLEGAERIRRIVRALLDFADPGASGWRMVDLHAALESTIAVAWNQIKDKVEVVRDYGRLPPVPCLVSQLNQVFLNLLVNAAEAITGHGTVTLRTRLEGDRVRISFSDTGCGIAPEHREKLFEPFFTTKPTGKGSGLGLSMAYGIIERHGGRLEVSSEAGSGATFTIHLPVDRISGKPDCPPDGPVANPA
jgi:signal transduction histidine kinase